VRASKVLFFFLAFVFLAARSADACSLPQGKFSYDILNDNTPIGGAWIDFEREGTRTKVSTLIKVKVTLLYLIPLLNYRHQSEEIWETDVFQSFDGKTVDNRREVAIRIKPNSHGPNGQSLKVNRNGSLSEIETPLFSQVIWCKETLRHAQLFSPLKGRMKAIRTEDMGQAAITIRGQTHQAKAFALIQMRKGKPVRTDLWYGEDGVILKARFPSKRGTIVTFLRH